MHLKPMLAIVTNIDADHMSTYDGDIEKLRAGLRRVPAQPAVLRPGDRLHRRSGRKRDPGASAARSRPTADRRRCRRARDEHRVRCRALTRFTVVAGRPRPPLDDRLRLPGHAQRAQRARRDRRRRRTAGWRRRRRARAREIRGHRPALPDARRSRRRTAACCSSTTTVIIRPRSRRRSRPRAPAGRSDALCWCSSRIATRARATCSTTSRRCCPRSTC